MTPFIGFAPDVSPFTPGVMTDCAAIIPTLKGFKAAPSAVTTGVSVLPGVVSSAVLVRLDATVRIFAGTATVLYEKVGSGWTNVSRASPAYGASIDFPWVFSIFGNVSLAASKSDKIQQSASGNFSDIAAAPRAKIIVSVKNQVMALDYNDGVNDYPDGWFVCAIGDQTNWTPSIATLCTNGRLLDTPGPIRAGKVLGEQVVAYKDRAMYVGTFEGAPLVYRWDLIPGEIGCSSQDAVVNIGTAHIFVGFEDFYIFDGTRPIPLSGSLMGTPVKEWFFNDLDPLYRNRIKAVHDKLAAIVRFHYPSKAGGGVIDSCLVYNYKTNRWGKDDRVVSAVLEYFNGGLTYDEMGNGGITYDQLPQIPYDSPFWVSGSYVPGVFDTSGNLLTLTGSPANSSITTGNYGDDFTFSRLTRVRPHFLTTPATSTMEHFYKEHPGDSFTVGETVTMTDRRYDIVWSARWHRVKMNFTGPMEIDALAASILPDGTE